MTHFKRKLFMVFVMMLSLVSLVQAQMKRDITGVVTGPNKEPLIGVNVTVEGTTIGTTTDLDGQFTLSVDKDATLVISYIGFVTSRIKVGNQKIVNVVLKEDTKALDEVVVIGYGTQKKVDLTGSVGVVDMESAKKKPNFDAASMLQGQVPGVSVQTTSQPGSTASIRIRGIGSFNNVGPTLTDTHKNTTIALTKPNIGG
jgi:hypothetical protein